MSDAKRRYYLCENEALAVVFTLKTFGICLPGAKPSQLVTNHQAQSHTFKKKYVPGRLAGIVCQALVPYNVPTWNCKRRCRLPLEIRRISRASNWVKEEPLCIQDVEPSIVLEPYYANIAHYIGVPIEKPNIKLEAAVVRNSKKPFEYIGRLFQITCEGLRAMNSGSWREQILWMFHDDIGHWDFAATEIFVTDRFWGTSIIAETSK